MNIDSRLSSLSNQTQVVREETEIWWWIFAKRSKITHELFDSMNLYRAALCAGRELADIVKIPPLINYPTLINEALSLSMSEDLPLTSLEIATDEWEKELLLLIMPNSPTKLELIDAFPRMFPLHWIISRQVRDDMNGSWKSEFHRRTSIGKKTEVTSLDLANQIFLERIVTRVLDT